MSGRHHRVAFVLLLLGSAIALAPVGLAARNVPRTLAVRMTMTGEITRLGLDKIAIGHVGCAIPAKLEASAGRFVIADPVKIVCLNGRLQSVEYSPELPTAQTTKPGGGNAPSTVSAPPLTATAAAKSSAYSIGVLYLGGPPPGETTTVAGTISDVSSTSVTVAGPTCTFKPLPTAGLFAGPAVGDNVTLTCTGGLLIRLASSGVIPR